MNKLLLLLSLLICSFYSQPFNLFSTSNSALHSESTGQSNINSQSLKRVLFEPKLRQEFAQFLDNVLTVVPAEKFYNLIDSLPELRSAKTDREIYAILREHIDTIKPWIYRINLLNYQTEAVMCQVRPLLADTKNIDGYIEIGSPGNYLADMQNFVSVTGTKYVINDTDSLGKRLQAFTFSLRSSFLAYDKFIKLNNYAPLSSEIPDNSIDLIVCAIGLHHVPQEKLPDFVSSIKRVLRPGGLFILREHDSYSADLQAIVEAAHSVFNLIIPKETVESECAEYRNFQPLTYWIECVEKYGFVCDAKKFTQAGDPTRNTMLKFSKSYQAAEKEVIALQAIKKKHADYYRDITQSYLSTPEWTNVDVSQEYGKFIEHTPFYKFPYTASIKSYWSSFLGSWRAAAKRSSNFKVLTSLYTLMNIFIGITMTLEYTAKAIISAPVRWIYSGSEPDIIKALVKDPGNQIDTLNSGIKILDIYPEAQIKLIAIPRYKQFLLSLRELTKTDSVILEIAGHKEIQFKIRHKIDTAFVDLPVGCIKEYDWTLPTVPGYTYSALTVQVSKLKESMTYLAAKQAEIVYVHDF